MIDGATFRPKTAEEESQRRKARRAQAAKLAVARLGAADEAMLFLGRWLKAPHIIGAMAPSSRYLAQAMARQIDGGGAGPVIELGGGTGSITRALLESGIAPERLVVVERDKRLHRLLRQRFPEIRVVRGDARYLVELMRPLGITAAATVVSSLPLLTMAKELRRRIIAQSFALLGDCGELVQYTYGLTSPLAGPEYGITGRIAARVWRNFPPASVWRFRRQAGPAMAWVA